MPTRTNRTLHIDQLETEDGRPAIDNPRLEHITPSSWVVEYANIRFLVTGDPPDGWETETDEAYWVTGLYYFGMDDQENLLPDQVPFPDQQEAVSFTARMLRDMIDDMSGGR